MQNLKKFLSGGGLFLIVILSLFVSWPTDLLAGSADKSGKTSDDGSGHNKNSLALDDAVAQTMDVLAKVKMDENQLSQAKRTINSYCSFS